MPQMRSEYLVKLKEKRLKELMEKKPDTKRILVIISNSSDEASNIYVRMKKRKCEEFNIETIIIDINKFRTPKELKEGIASIIKAHKLLGCKVGLMVQRPIPHEFEIAEDLSLHPFSDVDGTTAVSIGSIAKNNTMFEPCTPKGIMRLLKYYDVELEGKNVVIINRSNILGKPLALMMTNANATVTLAHSKTRNLKDICKRADIVVTGMGNNTVLNKEYFKDKAVIVDTSTIKTEEGLSGDIPKKIYEELESKNCLYTPVPGGVGPMTITSLIENVLNL